MKGEKFRSLFFMHVCIHMNVHINLTASGLILKNAGCPPLGSVSHMILLEYNSDNQVYKANTLSTEPPPISTQY